MTIAERHIGTLYLAAAAVLLCVIAVTLRPDAADATFPGRNGKIVLVRDVNGSSRAVLIGDRSGRMHTLSRGFGFAAEPDFSPDGRRIVFLGRRPSGSTAQIWSIRPDGSGLRRLTSGPGDKFGPAYGPSGRFVFYNAYDQRNEFETYDLWRLDLRSGAAQRIGGELRSVIASPRGRIFVAVGQPSGYSKLYTARLDGSRVKLLTQERYFAEQPDFSPNGRWIAYKTLRPCPGRGNTGNAIVITNPTGTETRVIEKDCKAALGAPVFSPNGQFLSFSRRGVRRIVTFPRPGRIGHLLRNRPQGARDTDMAWQPLTRR